MLGHAARSPELRVIPTSAQKRAPDPKVAVVLNANARQVSERVRRSLTHVVPEEDVFLSRTAGDLRGIVQTLLDRRYDTVFCGGGDGTFTSFVNELYAQLAERNLHHPQPAPRLGILKLGTGNGLASLVRASPLKGDRILDDVLRARAGEVPGYRPVELICVNGRRAVFAGVGLDGQILNDYGWVKERLGSGLLSKVMTGELGYLTSVTLRTVPAVLTQPSFSQVRVVNGEAPAYRMASDGSVAETIAPGAVVYQGKINIVSAATVPFFGYAFRAFPFAGQRPGTMHLRLGACTAPQVIGNLPKLWKGKTTDFLHDFLVGAATVELERPMPLQIGGDGEGLHQRVDLRMSGEHVELVDFSGAVS